MSFDLDAALGLPFTFTFGGEDYTLPNDVDLDSVKKLSDGDPEAALLTLLGEEQHARMSASAAVFGARAFAKLMDAYFQHLGIRSGESSGSTVSSKSMVEPSKPTYSGTLDSSSETLGVAPV